MMLMGQLGCMETVQVVLIMKKVTTRSKKYTIRGSHREGREPMVVQILFIDLAEVKEVQHHHW